LAAAAGLASTFLATGFASSSSSEESSSELSSLAAGLASTFLATGKMVLEKKVRFCYHKTPILQIFL
jgi:hypothetical protein